MFAAIEDVLDFGGAPLRPEEGGLLELIVTYGDVEAIAEGLHLFEVQLFLLMGDVAALARFAEAVAFDGLGEDDRRGSAMVDGLFISGVDLGGIVSAAGEFVDLFV